MPRAATERLNPSETAPVQVVLFKTDKAIRFRNIGIYVNTAIAGGNKITCQVGLAGGAEVVASHDETISGAGNSSNFTLLNAVVAAGQIVTYKVTFTDRASGDYQIYFIWDNDF